MKNGINISVSQNQSRKEVYDKYYLNKVMEQNRRCFKLAVTDMGETVYEWIEDDVQNLSSMRLADILRSLEHEACLSQDYRQAVQQELVARNHYQASRNWQSMMA